MTSERYTDLKGSRERHVELWELARGRQDEQQHAKG